MAINHPKSTTFAFGIGDFLVMHMKWEVPSHLPLPQDVLKGQWNPHQVLADHVLRFPSLKEWNHPMSQDI